MRGGAGRWRVVEGGGGWWGVGDGAAHPKHAMTVATLTFERILWQSYCFPYSN